MRVFVEHWDSSYELGPGETLLGRDGSCQIRLEDDAISRRHLRFVVHERGATVEDLETTNGTELNGRPLARRESLFDGDVLRIGHGVITVKVEHDERTPTDARRRPTAPMQLPPPLFCVNGVGTVERRRQHRVPVNIPAQYTSSSKSVSATVRDLSPEGAFLAVDQQDPVVTRCQVTLFPEGTAPLATQGVVRHVVATEATETRTPGLGIKFTKMDKNARLWLTQACKDPH